ncbi:MAG: heteromeric transposase endonuclease subunit TnsA [Clostridiales bacterium]|jgi:hypothetical protein|nr:heteromeric transposase endonuclease subunit TnsA [Clostridiales bacterium]
MSKHSRVWNQSIFEKYLREGRGRGDGPGYMPWIRIQDFASNGVVSRVKGRKTGRIHHLMSNNELAYFYLLDWSDSVLDIREQYPLLDLDCAIKAATQAGIKYPTDNVSGYPYVMTCDFLITTAQGLKARTIKLSSELTNTRTVEKLEIERRYWAANGVDWKLVTENEISYRKAKNIEWIYSAQDFEALQSESDAFIKAKDLTRRLFNSFEFSIVEIAQIVEDKFHFGQGIGLLLFKVLVLNGEIYVDLNKRLNLNAKKVAVTA